MNRYYFSTFLFAAVGLSAVAAVAPSTHSVHVATSCAGYGGVPIKYSWSQPQSGVAIKTSEKLTLRDEVLINKGMNVDNEVAEATFKQAPQKILLELKSGDSKYTAYLASGKVVATAGHTLWQGIVECQKVEEKFKALP